MMNWHEAACSEMHWGTVSCSEMVAPVILLRFLTSPTRGGSKQQAREFWDGKPRPRLVTVSVLRYDEKENYIKWNCCLPSWVDTRSECRVQHQMRPTWSWSCLNRTCGDFLTDVQVVWSCHSTRSSKHQMVQTENLDVKSCDCYKCRSKNWQRHTSTQPCAAREKDQTAGAYCKKAQRTPSTSNNILP